MDARLLKADAIVFDVGNVLLTFEPEKVGAREFNTLRGSKSAQSQTGLYFFCQKS